MFYYLTSNGARVGNNVVFVRDPGNPFDPSYMKVGLSRNSCVYIFGHMEARVASIITPLGTRLENPGQEQCFFAYYTTIT